MKYDLHLGQDVVYNNCQHMFFPFSWPISKSQFERYCELGVEDFIEILYFLHAGYPLKKEHIPKYLLKESLQFIIDEEGCLSDTLNEIIFDEVLSKDEVKNYVRLTTLCITMS